MGARWTRLDAVHPGDLELSPSGRRGSCRERLCAVVACAPGFSAAMDDDNCDFSSGLIRSDSERESLSRVFVYILCPLGLLRDSTFLGIL